MPKVEVELTLPNKSISEIAEELWFGNHNYQGCVGTGHSSNEYGFASKKSRKQALEMLKKHILKLVSNQECFVEERYELEDE